MTPLTVLLAALLACRQGEEPHPQPEPDPYAVPIGPYDAQVRWTAYGVPHVLAADHGSLGYGMGYALARDHVCTLADQIVRVRSERARYHGAGEGNLHLDGDFGWLALGVFARAERSFLGLPADLQARLVGYAEGYNTWVEEAGPDGLPEACRGAEWVKRITHVDLYAYGLLLGEFASGDVFWREIANAQPPGGLRSASPPTPAALERAGRLPLGSNGWAIGGDRSASGRGMLLANPHFPAEGPTQFHEVHLTVPGELDVYGASLVGLPVVNIGFTETTAWTHTVSPTPRFVLHQLTLDPADPTRYLYDGEHRAMTATEHAVEVLGADGSLETVSRTLYRTHHGPLLDLYPLGWTAETAFAMQDINERNDRIAQVWWAMNEASDLAGFQAAHAEHMGVPWVTTVFADAEGNAWYADTALTPNLSPEAEQAYASWVAQNPLSVLFADFGVYLVDGADPVYDLVDDPAAAIPGTVPFERVPQLLRRDYVLNANDNHWLPNVDAPLDGFPMLYGEVGQPLIPRTRMNHRYATELDGASGPDHRFSLDELVAVAVSSRGIVAEVLLDQVVARCAGAVDVDVAAACAVLAAWDGAAGPGSAGAVLWREVVGSEQLAYEDLTGQGSLFADAFDPADPIDTPAELVPAPTDGSSDPVLELLAGAVARLAEAGVPLDATLAEAQFLLPKGDGHPVWGGSWFEGTISVAEWSRWEGTSALPVEEPPPLLNERSGLSEGGYFVNSGNSWLLALEFGEEGPEARAVMVYSQSESPASPHFVDQTALYGDGSLRPVLFREADILADPALEVQHLVLE